MQRWEDAAGWDAPERLRRARDLSLTPAERLDVCARLLRFVLEVERARQEGAPRHEGTAGPG